MTLTLMGVVISILGPGGWSLDNTTGLINHITGWTGLAIGLGAGAGGALALLAGFWRPQPKKSADPAP